MGSIVCLNSYLFCFFYNPNCPDLSFFVNITLLWGRLVFGGNASYVLVPATGLNFFFYGYSMNPDIPSSNDTSVMGLVVNDQADITVPLMTFLEKRRKLAAYSRANLYETVCYLYKPIIVPNQLSVTTLFVEARGVWLMISVCFISRRIMAWIFTKQLISRSVSMRSLLRFRDRISILLFFFYGLALSVLSKYLFAVFSLVQEKPLNISNANQLAQALTSGHYAAVTDSAAWKNNLLDTFIGPKTELDRVLNEHPLIVLEEEEEMEALLAIDKPRHVLVNGEFLPLMARLSRKTADYVKYCDDQPGHGIMDVTFVSARVKPIVDKLTYSKILTFNALLNKYKSEQFQNYTYNDNEDTDKRKPTFELGFGQISGLVQAAAMGLACGCVFLLAERVASLY